MKNKEEKLIKFIKDNKIELNNVGSRNSNSTTISGFALYLEIDDYDDLVSILITNNIDYSDDELYFAFKVAKRLEYGKIL